MINIICDRLEREQWSLHVANTVWLYCFIFSFRHRYHTR